MNIVINLPIGLVIKTPVGKALVELKPDFMEQVKERAQRIVDNIRKDLADHKWILNKAAPFPELYFHKKSIKKVYKRRLYISLTDYDNTKTRQYVEINNEAIELFISGQVLNASNDYDRMICRTVSKIGRHIKADIFKTHIIIEKETLTEHYKLKQSWNVSKNGKNFQQWNLRLLK